MKTRLAIILAALLLAASMTACGNSNKNNEETTTSNKIDINNEVTTSKTEETTDAGEQTTDGETDIDEIKDPGEYSYTILDNAEKIQVMGSTGAANLRTADYAIVTSVPNGTQLDRVGISNGSNGYWSKVIYNGEECYIASHLVTTVINLDEGFVAVNKTLTKNAGSLNVRIAPDPDSEVIGYVDEGQQVTITAENTTTGWYKISFIPYGGTEATVGYIVSNPEHYETEASTEVNTEATN